MYRPGNRVRIEHGVIPQWGSANPTALNFGKTEPGYRIIVEKRQLIVNFSSHSCSIGHALTPRGYFIK